MGKAWACALLSTIILSALAAGSAAQAAPSARLPAVERHSTDIAGGPFAGLNPNAKTGPSADAPVAERGDAMPPPPEGSANPSIPFPSEGTLDMEANEAALADPEVRAAMLTQLYDTLRTAPDAEKAALVQVAIEKLWHTSGSPTIDLLLQRAESFGQEQDYDLAIEILDAAIKLSPETAELWHQRAMIRFLREEHSEALSDLRQTLSLDTRHYQAILGLARVLEHVGQKKSALAVYRRALDINPHMEDAKTAVDELSREVEGQDI